MFDRLPNCCGGQNSKLFSLFMNLNSIHNCILGTKCFLHLEDLFSVQFSFV
uniref:Uncharacterized protein n=1 Tax=Rhizophora mucronata TaxID=61149 RepID=A0A2P2J3S7_RHIMU